VVNVNNVGCATVVSDCCCDDVGVDLDCAFPYFPTYYDEVRVSDLSDVHVVRYCGYVTYLLFFFFQKERHVLGTEMRTCFGCPHPFFACRC